MAWPVASTVAVVVVCCTGVALAADLHGAPSGHAVAEDAGLAAATGTEDVAFSKAFVAELVVLPIVWAAVIAYGFMQARTGSKVQARTLASPAVPVRESEMAEGVARAGAGATGRSSASSEARAGRLGVPEAHGEERRRERSGSEATGSFISDISKGKLAQELGIAEPGTNTFYGTIVNIITGGLGAGILCLPWAAAGASLSTAVVIIAVVLWVNAYTINLLVEAADKRKIFDIAALLGELPGNLASSLQLICNVVVWVSMFLCLISYYIVISDCTMKALLSLGLVADAANKWLRPATLIVTAVVLTPMCFLDQDKLAFTSTLTVIVNVYVFGVIGVDVVQQFSLGLGQGAWQADTPVCVFGFGYGSIAMCATMMQCVIIQMCVLPMYAELKDPSPEKFRYIVNASFAGLFLLFSGFAVAGVLAYGERSTDENVLNNLGTSTSDAIAQGGMVFCIVAVYPIMLLPMVAPVKNSNNHKHFATPITIGLVVASCIAAFPLSSLGELSIVNGSMSVGVFVGLIPGLVGLYLLKRSVVTMTILAATMIIMTVFGLTFRDNIYDGDVCFAKAW